MEGNIEAVYPEGVAAPHLTSFHKTLKGHTFKRGRVETRGHPQELSAQAVRKLDKVRKDLIKKANGEAECSQIVRERSVAVYRRVRRISMRIPTQCAQSVSDSGDLCAARGQNAQSLWQ